MIGDLICLFVFDFDLLEYLGIKSKKAKTKRECSFNVRVVFYGWQNIFALDELPSGSKRVDDANSKTLSE